MKSLAMILVTLFSMNVFANDGGIAYINVKGIDPTTRTDEYGAKQVLTFYGKDTRKFMEILPPSFSVVSAMYPHLNYEENFKSLALVSNGNILNIYCETGELNFPGDNTATLTPYAAGPKCTVTIRRREAGSYLEDYLGDATEFDKESMVCEQK